MTTQISGSILRSDSTPYPEPYPTVLVRQVVPQPNDGTLLLPGTVTFSVDASGFLSVSLDSNSDGTAYEFKIVADYETDWFVATLYHGLNLTWNEIIPTTVPSVRPDLDRSVARVAQQITSDVSVAGLLRQSIGIIPRGSYDENTYYRQGDLVEFQGASYTPLLPRAIKGIAPTTQSNWQLVAARGIPGGTGGNNADYNYSGWLADATDAPTRRALAAKLNTIDTTLSNTVRTDKLVSDSQIVNGTLGANVFYATNTVDINGDGSVVPNSLAVRNFTAPKNNPVFTGTVSVPTRPIDDNTTAAANSEFVNNRITQNNTQLHELNFTKITAMAVHSSASCSQNTGAGLANVSVSGGSWVNIVDPVGIISTASIGIIRLRTTPLPTLFPNKTNFAYRISCSYSLLTSAVGVQNARWVVGKLYQRSNGGAWTLSAQLFYPYVQTSGYLGINGEIVLNTGYLSLSTLNQNIDYALFMASQEASAGLSWSGLVNWTIELIAVS